MAGKNSKPARVPRRARTAATPAAPGAAARERHPRRSRRTGGGARPHRRVDEQIHGLLNERARLAQQVGISKSSGRTVDFYRPEREAQVLRLAQARNAGPLRDAEVLRLSARSCRRVSRSRSRSRWRSSVRRHLHANRGAQSFRTLGARPATRLDRRGVSRGGSGERRFRGRAHRELHRGHGQPHARPVPHLAAEDLRGGGAARASSPHGCHERVDAHRASLLPPAVSRQCRQWLEEHLPVSSRCRYRATRGARRARDEKGSAAIAGETAAEVYGLKILVAEIEDRADNTTRFLYSGASCSRRAARIAPRCWCR